LVDVHCPTADLVVEKAIDVSGNFCRRPNGKRVPDVRDTLQLGFASYT
jgi:hypothetical protein